MEAEKLLIRLTQIGDEIRSLKKDISEAHDFDGWLTAYQAPAYQALKDAYRSIDVAREAIWKQSQELRGWAAKEIRASEKEAHKPIESLLPALKQCPKHGEGWFCDHEAE